MSASTWKTWRTRVLLAGLVLGFCLYQHYEYRGQHPNVEPKFMQRSFVSWKTATGVRDKLIVVRKVYFDYTYNSWVYEIRQGPNHYRALEIELDVYLH